MNIKLSDKQQTISRMLEILGYSKMAIEAKKESNHEALCRYAKIVIERAKGENREKAIRWFGYLRMI